MSETALSKTELWSLCKLGHQLYSRNRYDDAATIFEGLVALDDTLGYPWHALGLIARERSDRGRAVECFERRLELDPEADESRVQLAEVLYESGRVEEAIGVLEHFFPPEDDSSRAARRGRALRKRWG